LGAHIPGGPPALSETERRFPIAVFIDLLHGAERELGETGIGLKVGRNFRPTTFADFSHGLLVNDTLHGAMAFNRKYQAVNQQYGRATLITEGASAYVQVEPAIDDIDYMRPAMEAIFAGYVGIGKWLTWTTGEDVRSMRFRNAKPTHTSLLEDVFECPVLFDEPVDQLEIDAALVDKPFPARNPHLVKTLSRRLDVVLEALDNPDSVRLATYRAIEETLISGAPTIGTIASRMGIAERTLRRKLSAEDASFSGVLVDVRRNLSEVYLSQPNMPMAEVAQVLGYSEQSAFIRAFRGWFGTTPSDYRATIG